jgi:regulatory protein
MVTATIDVKLVNKYLSSTLRFLSIRNRSQKEIQDYLAKKTHHNEPLIDAVMSRLSHFNLLNDHQFARDWVDMRLKQGKGPILIHQELKLKGINSNLIDQTLHAIDTNQWFESAQAVTQKKHLLPRSPTNFGEKAKTYRYLQSRGFPPSIIRAVIDGKAY